MIVMKFGGTSVEDARAYSNVLNIIKSQRSRKPVVVLSAISGATNLLLETGRLAIEGRLDEALARLFDLQVKHLDIAENVIQNRMDWQPVIAEIKGRFEEMRNICRGVALLGELTPRTLDVVASFGELLSSKILAEALKSKGIRAEYVDARRFMITDGKFMCAEPQFDIINEKARVLIKPLIEKDCVVVTQGFIGATASGITTTLGRGGSDYSASIIGAALDAEEIQIWTDVDGLLSADPRIAPKAMRIKQVSFREASELAYFGAHVLHPSTILPAVAKNIPVSVLNSKNPSSRGTLITANPKESQVVVKSVASKKGIAIINIQSTRMLMAHGFLESIFAIFKKYKTSVDLVTTSEVAVSLTIDDMTYLNEIVSELKSFAEVAVKKSCAIVCVVGEQVGAAGHVAKRLFAAIDGIEIFMFSQGASEINMSFAVNESDAAECVARLHREFCENIGSNDLFEQVINF